MTLIMQILLTDAGYNGNDAATIINLHIITKRVYMNMQVIMHLRESHHKGNYE